MRLHRKMAAVFFGSLMVAIGINLCFVPNELMDGGLVGVALILNYIWKVKVGLALVVLSIPIFVWAWNRNRSFFFHSLHGMLISSVLIDVVAIFYRQVLVPEFGPMPLHPLAGAIGGGLLVGTGIGLMLRYQVSTGGTDLLAQFLSELLAMNVGIIILWMDVAVLFIGALLLSGETLLLSVIAVLAVAVATSCMVQQTEEADAR
ncbi:YitT family protein [Gorillibacterium sp. sgz5001074]|uniref:YitT family protein n=1 Tax=Gorillibacterium sp. sgz5001074 TaxID=3446695 RepID=UPI003F66CDB1